METVVFARCPYCGKENSVRINYDRHIKTIVNCDWEAQGCQRDFVADIFFIPQVDSFKIEGEAGKYAEGGSEP